MSSDKTRRVYMADAIMPWSWLTLESGLPIEHRLQAPAGSPGLIMVYDTAEAAMDAHPDAAIRFADIPADWPGDDHE